MVAPRFVQFPNVDFLKGWTTETEEMICSLIQTKYEMLITEANGGCTRARGYYALWKYYIWNFRTWL